jgi:hypothetical protein
LPGLTAGRLGREQKLGVASLPRGVLALFDRLAVSARQGTSS